MTFEQILSNLHNKIYHPVYLLQGEEPWYIDQISDLIEDNVLDENEKEFNQMVFYGRDSSVQQIVDAARRYPMMANHMVIIVKEAQDLKKIEDLATYCQKPTPTTILVLCHKHRKVDGRRALAGAVKKTGVLFEAKQLYENQLPEWIRQHIEDKGYSITPNAVMMMAENIGTNLSKIDNETQKLLVNLPAGGKITEALVEQNIGISKDYNVFELTKAIGQRNQLKAIQIILYFADNPNDHPMVLLTGALTNYFLKIIKAHALQGKDTKTIASVLEVNPFFVQEYTSAARNYTLPQVKQIINLLKQYDLRSKGVDNTSTEQGELMKELVFRILNPS